MEILDLYRRHRSYIFANKWVTVLALIHLAICGADKRSQLASPIFTAACAIWTVHYVAYAYLQMLARQRHGLAFCLSLALTFAGNGLAILRERWELLFLWYGSMLLCIGAATASFDCHGPNQSSRAVATGAVMLAGVAAFEALARRTQRLGLGVAEGDARLAARGVDAGQHLARDAV